MFRVIRPSGMDRTIKCPGSLAANDNAPSWADEYDNTTARDEGTACHWLAERVCLDDEIVTVGDKAPNGITTDAGMFDAAFLYRDTLRGWGTHRIHIEQSVAVPQLPYTAGTPDAFAWDAANRIIYLADLKYGYRLVDVLPNWQLLCYMLGIADWLGQDWRTVTFNLTIVQPRRYHIAGPVRSAIVRGDSEQLATMVGVARQAIEEALSPAPRMFPGNQCKHCPGRARCTALQNAVADGVYVDAHDLTFSQAENELAYLQRQSVLLEAYISGLKAQVEHGIRNGATSTKYELRRSAGRLAWDADAADKIRALARHMGVKVDKAPELITPTQAAKLMGSDAVNMFARRSPGSLELAATDIEIHKRIFGK